MQGVSSACGTGLGWAQQSKRFCQIPISPCRQWNTQNSSQPNPVHEQLAHPVCYPARLQLKYKKLISIYITTSSGVMETRPVVRFFGWRAYYPLVSGEAESLPSYTFTTRLIVKIAWAHLHCPWGRQGPATRSRIGGAIWYGDRAGCTSRRRGISCSRPEMVML